MLSDYEQELISKIQEAVSDLNIAIRSFASSGRKVYFDSESFKPESGMAEYVEIRIHDKEDKFIGTLLVGD